MTSREVTFDVGVDYFDRLPDDVLIQILERLDLNDAATTSILSRRLLGLWKLLTPYRQNLDFRGLPSQSKNFEKFVKGVMWGHKGHSVDSLKISISEPNKSFNNWFSFARTKCVKNLEIKGCLHATDFAPYGTGFSVGWDKLTSLTLRYVGVRREELEEGLKKDLMNLESLCIEHAISLKTLQVSSQSLKRLEFSLCASLDGVDIVPNLQFYKRMDGHTWSSNVLRINGAAPKLSRICLDAPFIEYHIPQLHYTEVEKLEVYVSECTERLPRDLNPRLRNLKELILTFEMRPWGCFFFVILAHVLPTCPQLQKLTLYYHQFPRQLYDHMDSYGWCNLKRAELDARSRVHECLKVVEFRSWSGRENEVEAANLVKEIAPNLEKITYG